MQQPAIGLLISSFLLETLIYVFFCLTLTKALNTVKVENRTVSPGQIWFFLIPGFNIFWLFFLVSRMASSLKNELIDRDYEVEENPGYNIGMTAAGISILILLIYILEGIGIQNTTLTFILGAHAIMRLIFFIQYWMKIAWYRKVLETNASENTEEEE